MVRNNRLKKKGFTPMEVMIGIIISVVSFYIIFVFLVSNKDVVGSYAQDLQCRATIEAKSTTTVDAIDTITNRVGIDSFTNVLNNKCPVDYITIKSDKKDEIFKKIADEEARCWYRYGEGEKDFLSSFETSGNWCFICGVAKVESSNEKSYDYAEYINWLNTAEYEKKDGKSVTYAQHMKIIYPEEISNDDLIELNSEINGILSENDPAFQAFATIILNQYESYQDLRLRKISTNENLYVVYRYDRLDKSISEKMTQATIGAGAGLVGGIVVGAIIENGLLVAGSSLACAGAVFTGWTGAGALVFGGACISGTAKTIEAITKSSLKAAESTAKITRLSKLMSKIASKIKYTKDVAKVSELSELKYLDKVEDVVKLADELRNEKKYVQIVEKLDRNAQLMKKYDIKTLDELPARIGTDKANLEELKQVIKESNNVVETELATGLKEVAEKNLKDLESINFEDPQAAIKMRDVLKSTLPLMGAASGGYTGYNINSNYNQYIDIMTKEQYFRLCGTEKKIQDRMDKLK